MQPKNIITMLFLLCAVVSGILVFQVSGSHELEIVFLDVGQGDATLITTPRGRQVLIDTGVDNAIGGSIARYMDVTDRSLDMVIMTHPDTDHVGGMISLLKKYEIETIVHSGLLAGAPIYGAIVEGINQSDSTVITAEAGQMYELEDGITLEVLHPRSGYESLEPNEYSIILRLTYGEGSALLMGDATKINEYELVNTYGDDLKSDILKVGHHGSQTSSGENFLKKVNADFGIISAGCNNRFGHPHGEVLARLFTNNIEVLDTCGEGDIIFQSDGEGWIRK